MLDKQQKKVTMNPLKYSLVLAFILIMPFIYGHYMIFWSDISMSIAESFNISATISISIINIFAIIALSIIIALPLSYIFSAYSYYVATCIAIAIISWQIFILLSADTITLNIINYSEWLALLLCMPLIVFYVYKLRYTNA